MAVTRQWQKKAAFVSFPFFTSHFNVSIIRGTLHCECQPLFLSVSAPSSISLYSPFLPLSLLFQLSSSRHFFASLLQLPIHAGSPLSVFFHLIPSFQFSLFRHIFYPHFLLLRFSPFSAFCEPILRLFCCWPHARFSSSLSCVNFISLFVILSSLFIIH